ncbi:MULTISPECIES: proline racemase [unclassified Clostridioides]|uniref:proline racemase n=1 Tax=unclassified Clostridioides TaxID=2635829 RepID=UPI001D123ED1|nr:proline racemase [Clostridioides sp. ZZV15-6388]MCC0645594.1 proline racemase [Clostridioides sp. ZZV14-6150]MCC0660552.1 proline racemase [Clostridioides sp. ZZV14-6154]MCC0665457.1 proline racemase [Clostridioides sp. ZZV15-6597]MCC0669569.1 proline racemase [Clostridioides sp. ZZV14-6153]MCC0718745.1 proline racemase [Clostridioides sp. ZZV14-6105]MCC0723412.1 proline racemase [Clostridioides sp. ZZV14-6104]MCC0726652.1 proline racemase [Clostridioides sp. ZZV14-6045]MCC0730520.1 prol
MKFSRSIQAIDSHTAGEATRIVVGGIPNIKGNSMPEKKEYLEKNLDYLRTAIMLEPRGHNDMFGSVMTQPCCPDADFGIIFMDGGGYLNMCGHGTIGAMTAAIETGVVPAVEPVTHVVMEAPAGIIRGDVTVVDGKAKEVSFLNVPAFLYKEGVEVDLPGVGTVKFDISFGGSFFAIIHASQLGLKIEPQNAGKLTELAMKLRDIINEKIEIQHPTLAHIKTVDLVEIYDEPTHPEATYKNVVIFGQGQVDRSPCGTGTSAKLATLHAKGELKVGEKFVYESILGTLFKGEIVEETKVADFNAVVPKISGSAYITGFNHFVIDEEDPLKHGFILK